MLSEEGPYLLEVKLSQTSKVYPKLAFGRRFGEMEPEASPLAMEFCDAFAANHDAKPVASRRFSMKLIPLRSFCMKSACYTAI